MPDTTADEVEVIVKQLDSRERYVLQMLTQQRTATYGQFSGRTLDDLIARRLAEVRENGAPQEHWPTRCTALGEKVVERLANKFKR